MLIYLQMKTKRWSNEDFGLDAGEGQGAQGAQGALVVVDGQDAQGGVNGMVVEDPEGMVVDSKWVICRLGWMHSILVGKVTLFKDIDIFFKNVLKRCDGSFIPKFSDMTGKL